MPDLICLGELLMDFVSETLGASLEHAVMYRRAPGGAPTNVACGAVKLGCSAGLVAKVGNDSFGRHLLDVLRAVGVETSQVAVTPKAHTSIVFAAAHRDGHKEMAFYRGADLLLDPGDVHQQTLQQAQAFHFGPISMTASLCRAATIHAALAARQAGLLVSFDPNYRAQLWNDDAIARQMAEQGLRLADVVKLAEEEWPIITGISNDEDRAARHLLAMGPRLVILTRGAAGCTWFARHDSPAEAPASADLSADTVTFSRGNVPGFGVEAVETTGAGDGFMASLLVDLIAQRRSGRALSDLNAETLQHICRRANAAGALTCTRSGAIPGLPTRQEVDQFMASRP